MTYKLVFIANGVHSADSRFGFKTSADDNEEQEERANNFTIQEQHEVRQMSQMDDLLVKLSKSVAPSVYGHNDVKKGILLQLFGGV